MTRTELETFMNNEGWSPAKKMMWSDYTPVCSLDEFKSELENPGGIVEVTLRRIEQMPLRGWIEKAKAALSLSAVLVALLLSSVAAHAQAMVAPGASAVAVSAVGTTGVVTATMPALASQTNWICGFSIRASATAAVTGDATVTGTVNTLHFTQPVGTTPAVGVTEESFDPCIPASAFNTAIAVNSIAASTGGVTSVTVWGYSKP